MILVFWNLMLCCWVNDFRSFLMSGAFIFKNQTIPFWSYSLNCFTFTKKATSFQNSWTTKQLTTDHLLFFLWRCGPTRAMASSFTKFLDHTQRRITVGRTSLDEWSARRRDFYLTAHNTHNRQMSMPLVGFEPTTPAGKWPQTYALDRAATGTGIQSLGWHNNEGIMASLLSDQNMCVVIIPALKVV